MTVPRSPCLAQAWPVLSKFKTGRNLVGSKTQQSGFVIGQLLIGLP